MPFNGTGTFTLPTGNPVSGISNATVHNNTNAEIAVALTNCVTRDGQSPLTANMPLAGFKLTGSAVGASPGDLMEFTQTATIVSGLQADINTRLLASQKDATGGFPGLTLFKINFKNVANTFTSFFTNSNTAARTYTFPDRDLTVIDESTVSTTTRTYTLPQRGVVTSANGGSFDMNLGNNFKCTPTAGFTLTFTNITAGQSGTITLVNGANYAVARAAAVKVDSSFLLTVSVTGTYTLFYFSPDGVNVFVSTSEAQA